MGSDRAARIEARMRQVKAEIDKLDEDSAATARIPGLVRRSWERWRISSRIRRKLKEQDRLQARLEHEADLELRRSDPAYEAERQRRNRLGRAIRRCETLSRHIGRADEKLAAAIADLTENPGNTAQAWAHEVLQVIGTVESAARSVNRASPPEQQLQYRSLKRIRRKLVASHTPEPVKIAQFTAYQEALATLRRDVERLQVKLASNDAAIEETQRRRQQDEVTKRMDDA